MSSSIRDIVREQVGSPFHGIRIVEGKDHCSCLEVCRLGVKGIKKTLIWGLLQYAEKANGGTVNVRRQSIMYSQPFHSSFKCQFACHLLQGCLLDLLWPHSLKCLLHTIYPYPPQFSAQEVSLAAVTTMCYYLFTCLLLYSLVVN